MLECHHNLMFLQNFLLAILVLAFSVYPSTRHEQQALKIQRRVQVLIYERVILGENTSEKSTFLLT